MFPKWSDWNITLTKQGLRRQRMRRAARLLATLLLVLSVQQIRQGRLDISSVAAAAKSGLRRLLDIGRQALA